MAWGDGIGIWAGQTGAGYLIPGNCISKIEGSMNKAIVRVLFLDIMAHKV